MLVLLLLLAGCARELGGSGSDRGPGVATSPEAARNKLALLLADPCYTAADARGVWPRCGRWTEEAVSTARAAGTALPGDAALAAAVTGVQGGRDTFAARGCTGQAPAAPIDAGACIGALISTRQAVTALGSALRVAP